MNSAATRRRGLRLLALAAQAATLAACALQQPAGDDGEAGTVAAPQNQPDHRPQQREFRYDIAAPGRSQEQLWHAASTYFSIGMGVNSPRFDQLDEDAGTMEGRGLEPWRLPGSGICFTRYALRFAAQDGRAHLELEAFFGESEGPLDCAEWPILPRPSYEQLVADFNRTAEELATVLSAGNGARRSRGY